MLPQANPTAKPFWWNNANPLDLFWWNPEPPNSHLWMSRRSLVLLSLVVGFTLAIAHSKDIVNLDAYVQNYFSKKPSESLKEFWDPIDTRTADWRGKLDQCGNNHTCAEDVEWKAMNIERKLMDPGAMPACVEKKCIMMEEFGVLKREIKAGEDSLATFRKPLVNMKVSDVEKEAAKEPAASGQVDSTGKKQADRKDRKQVKKDTDVMLGDSKDDATINAETIVRYVHVFSSWPGDEMWTWKPGTHF